MFYHLKISLGNVHCSDCEVTIRLTLSKYWELHEVSESTDNLTTIPYYTMYYKLDSGVINLYYSARENVMPFQISVKSVVNALKNKGFVVLSWASTGDGKLLGSSEIISASLLSKDVDSNASFSIQKLWHNYKKNQDARHHLHHCRICKYEKTVVEKNSKTEAQTSLFDDASGSTLRKPDRYEYRAVFSIMGMSCVSCVSSVSEAIATLFQTRGIKERADEPQYSVNLLHKTAIVLIPDKQMVNLVIEAVDEAGFSVRLLEVLPVQRTINQKVIAIIGGITCAACVNSVMAAVNDLPFVLDCGINAISKSGQFILERSEPNDGKSNLDKLRDAVEACGFDFDLVKDEEINYTSGQRQSRSINIKVDGMFCKNCPKIVMSYLENFGEAVVIENPITLDQPFVKFTYIPNADQKITARRFLIDLNHLMPLQNEEGYTIESGYEGAFKCHLIEGVSIEEHLRQLLRVETRKIGRRLVIATVLAFPSFVFGIVGMSLIPRDNGFRLWLAEPIWAGNVSRVMWILLILSTPAYFFAADIFHIKAFKEVRSLWIHKNSFRRRLFKFGSMSLLMSLGTTVSYIASISLLIMSSLQSPTSEMGFHTTYFDSVVFLSFFLLIGRLLESLAKSKTADAVANLSCMKALQATVVERADAAFINDEIVDVKLLDSGEYIKIATGESPAVDCVIVEGTTSFDESALTGESNPVKHRPGQQIFSGTVNIGNSAVIAKILNIDGTSLIDQIVSTVRDGQMRKAPIQRLADVLTGYFVPLIVFIAVLTWIIWLCLAYSRVLPESYLDIDVGGWAVWSLEFAIAVFVIACPCGIGLAAPTALFVGSGLAAKYGILAKGGGAAFQDAARTNLVCFDKTGTLTQGALKVTDAAFIQHEAHGSVLKLFALQLTRDLELASKHPLATSIKEFLNSNFEGNEVLTSNKIPYVETIPGKGLKGSPVFDESEESVWSKFPPEEVVLGNEAILMDHNVEFSGEQKDYLTAWQSDKKSVVSVAIKCPKLFKDPKFHLVLMLACRDEIRPESKMVVDHLKKQGIECWMITGDNSLTASAIGSEIGIRPNRIISGVLPSVKQAKVQRLRDEGHIVAMVGDGINDAPALASADVGIALYSGADIAVTSSDFILLSKSYPLVTLFTLFDLAKVVFRRVKFNFVWSLVYNVIGVPIAAGVIYPYKNLRLSPVWASVAMAASSISVVASSLLLKLYRPKFRSSDFGTNTYDAELTVKVSFLCSR